ncbi:uncharacterized protein LOC132702805 [Cylas formicarius]|uniref:uncharacterized protein LOC132702805 n=1 Tax=Cylas formicarius TaxID=197179 RepID=UPI002958AEF6|nr:uncharacterized protein LOC132702805 [Cylas formicarius]
MNLNIQGGITNKKEALESILNNHDVNVLCISEHHESSDIKFLKLLDYKVLSYFSRTSCRGGGVCILGRESLNFSKIPFNNSEEKSFEMCSIKLELNKECVTIFSVYRSPKGDFEAFVEKLSIMFEAIYEPKNKHILCGDINVNLLENNKQTKILKNILLEYNLVASIEEPTRITYHSRTCIDNIFVDFTGLKSLAVDTCVSDHTFQLFFFEEFCNNNCTERFFRNFSENNVNSFIDLVSNTDWNNLFYDIQSDDLDKKFNTFYEKLKPIFMSCFPFTKKGKVSYRKKTNWFNRELRELSRAVHEMQQVNKRIKNDLYIK